MRPAARPRSPVGLLLLVLAAGATAVAAAGLPEGRGALLPLQDRVGEPHLARLTESLLRQELEAHGGLAPADEVRAVLRRLRIRDASDEPPERLERLAADLGADWFFLATLHELRRGRESARDDAGRAARREIDDDGDTPQVVLSARVVQPGATELWWAGFRAASGRDRESVFGLGEIDRLEDLLARSVRELVAAALEPRRKAARSRLRHRVSGFSRDVEPPSPPARVAVIPMDSVAVMDSSGAAEVATAALFATLDRIGFKALLPGLVRSIRQESGLAQPGGASRPEWEALRREGGADWVAAGTVETYRRGVGLDPSPWVAFSVRLLDARDGSIGWIDGLERTGRETAAAFDRGRIYSTGDLTYEMMRSLLDALRRAPAIAANGTGN